MELKNSTAATAYEANIEGMTINSYDPEVFATTLEAAFAEKDTFEVNFDDIQTTFLFQYFGEAPCPEKIGFFDTLYGTGVYEIRNDEGYSIWGLCVEIAKLFKQVLEEEYRF